MLKRVALVLLLLVVSGTYGLADDIGNYRIPQAVTYAGTPVPAGTYTIQIVQESDGPFLQLSKGGSVVARDLAIVIPASGAGRHSVQIARLAGQEFMRIRVRHQDNWYYAYMETGSR